MRRCRRVRSFTGYRTGARPLQHRFGIFAPDSDLFVFVFVIPDLLFLSLPPQTLPGKIEFDYLPENCQAVLMLPVHESSTVVVIGTNRARAFTPKDIAWMKGLSEQATLSLREAAMAL